MRSRVIIVAAASLAVGAMVSAWHARAEDRPNPNTPNSNTPDVRRNADQPTASIAERDRISSASAADQKAIRDTMATIVEDATTAGKFSDLQSLIAKPDRERATNKAGAGTGVDAGSVIAAANAGQNANATPANTPSAAQQQKGNDPARAGVGAGQQVNADLDAKIAQFQKDWKAKYNQDFKIRDAEQQVFTERFARIDTSNFGDAARTASERIAPSKDAKDASPSPRSDATARPGDAPAAANNAARNENRAMVSIPESHGAPMATLNFVNEGGTWKVALPGNVDNQTLQTNLAKHLDMADQDKANWPADVNDAYRAVSHHVLLALSESGTSRTGLDNPGAHTNQGNTGSGIGSGTDSKTGTNPGK